MRSVKRNFIVCSDPELFSPFFRSQISSFKVAFSFPSESKIYEIVIFMLECPLEIGTSKCPPGSAGTFLFRNKRIFMAVCFLRDNWGFFLMHRKYHVIEISVSMCLKN